MPEVPNERQSKGDSLFPGHTPGVEYCSHSAHRINQPLPYLPSKKVVTSGRLGVSRTLQR